MDQTVTHQDRILDQFSRQATLFQATHRSADAALKLVVDITDASAADTVLDVACGPGIVACALAEVTQHVTGIDITPAMLKHARALQAEKKLSNIEWTLGDVTRLPFEPETFSLVVSRYAIHHVQEPDVVVAEMARVCQSGGRVALIDSAPRFDQSDAFNATELIRDPSHTRALAPDMLQALMNRAGLEVFRSHLYAWEVPARGLIERSFPLPGGADRLRAIYRHDVGADRIGMNARYVDGELHVTFPTLILVGRKP